MADVWFAHRGAGRQKWDLRKALGMVTRQYTVTTTSFSAPALEHRQAPSSYANNDSAD
jgi:hypothetical protein